MPNSSLNPDTWIENINLFGGMIQVSQKIYIERYKTNNDKLNKNKKRVIR